MAACGICYWYQSYSALSVLNIHIFKTSIHRSIDVRVNCVYKYLDNDTCIIKQNGYFYNWKLCTFQVKPSNKDGIGRPVYPGTTLEAETRKYINLNSGIQTDLDILVKHPVPSEIVQTMKGTLMILDNVLL